MHFSKKDLQQTQQKTKDPVCGMDTTDLITHKHQGVQYSFCSDYCKNQFVENPTQYITNVV